MGALVCNHSTQEAETGGLWIRGYPRLWSKYICQFERNDVILSQTNKQKQQNYEPVQSSITVCMVTAEQMNK